MGMGIPARVVSHGKKALAHTQAAVEGLDVIAEPDIDKAFQTYASFSGDAVQTAHVLSIPVDEVLRLAEAHNWVSRLKAVFELQKTGKPKDVERAISRTINFVQAHRMRIVLDRIVNELYTKTGAELVDLCISNRLDKDGKIAGQTLNLKPYTELCAALEKVHMMTYYSLTDSPGERKQRKPEADDGPTLQDIHSQIAAAMAGQSQTPKELLDAEAKRQGQQAATVVSPPNPQ